MGAARVWTRRSATFTVLGLALALAAGVYWLLAPRLALLAGGLLLLGLGTTGYGIALRPRASHPRVLSTTATELADTVARQEAAALRRLLADRTGIGRPQAAQVRWRTDEGGETGSLNTIADFYQRLPGGRLVVVGPAGAGKTVLALRGLLDLIAALPEQPGVPGRVPIHLDLPDAGLPEDLDGWIAEQLVARYRIRPPIARALVEDGWILPVLDGLHRVTDPGKVVAALTPPRPVILISREDPELPDATAVHLQPLSIEQVAWWLTYQFPDPTKPPGVEHRWLRVLRHLADDRQGTLATALRSPLRLSRTVTQYRDPATNPDDLLTG
jgi:hypothetical protein